MRWPTDERIEAGRKKDDQPRCRHAIQRRGERNGASGKHGLHTPLGYQRNEDRRWRIDERASGKIEVNLSGGGDPVA